MNKFDLRNKIIENIQLPAILQKEYEAKSFEIYPSDHINQTEQIQHAIDFISNHGGGRLVIPSGLYHTGALELKSGVEIHLAAPSTILKFISSNLEKNYPLVLSHWESSPCMNYSPLIYGIDVHDVAITGPGILDGSADYLHWWNWHHQVENAWSEDKTDLQLNDRRTLRKMNIEGVPITDRIFGPDHYLRPNFIQIINSERILLRDFKIINSPMWLINPVLSRSITIDGIEFNSHGPNSDGCDPESCDGVWIKNCTFDTGDDCISLKSGRDRDGRELNTPCENILIENNRFSDGHGGIAIGSEMSGGIRYVLAANNTFTSPNLTYALRLKTNAMRGGIVEHIMFSDTTIKFVSGAAIHGTMLYEDGRKGDCLPVFRNISIENVTAFGGEYGIFLEAFSEVPIEGLVLKNIYIEGTEKTLYGKNWKDPLIDNLVINGKSFPRPETVQILGVPKPGKSVKAKAKYTSGESQLTYIWESSKNGESWMEFSREQKTVVPIEAKYIHVTSLDSKDCKETSIDYLVLEESKKNLKLSHERLICRGMLFDIDINQLEREITRGELSRILIPFAHKNKKSCRSSDTNDDLYCRIISNHLLPLDKAFRFNAQTTITRQEMATVAMQACGVSYKNASSTMPVCKDVDKIRDNYGTNVDRALYFGFMELEEGMFCPERNLKIDEAIKILDLVADFAGL